MADRHEPVNDTKPLQSALAALRLGGRAAVAAAIVVILITTVAAAWFTTALLAPAEYPAPALPEPPVAVASYPTMLLAAAEYPAPVLPEPPVKETSAAEHPRPTPAWPSTGTQTSLAKTASQFRGMQKPAPMLAAPSSALPSAPRNPSADEVLVITVPRPGEGPVLSADDEGVTPPALVSPRANIPLQQTDGAGDLSAIDLVISDKGEVESVKLASPVRDYREAMMLSAVKAWRFKPATVEGLPVRYKLRIHISVTSVATAVR